MSALGPKERSSRRALARVGAATLAAALIAIFVRALSDEGRLAGDALRLLAPDALFLLAALPLVPLLAAGSRAGLSRLGGRLSVLLRTLLFGALVLALARPSTREDTTRTSSVVLVDVSPSVSDDALAHARALVEALLAARGEATSDAPHVAIATFAGEPRRVETPRAGAPLALTRHDAERPATDLGSALRYAESLYQPGRARRLWILSDGVETRGQALSAVASLCDRGVRVSVTPLEGPIASELALTGLDFPELIRAGQPFDARVHVRASRASRARVRLFRDGRLVGLEGVREVDLRAGEDVVSFRVTAGERGVTELRAELEPVDPADDRFPENNRFVRAAEIVGRPRVLVLAPEPNRMEAFVRVLEAAELDVDVRAPRGLPSERAALSSFDAIVLADTPADQVSASSEASLVAFARAGGVLFVAGGPRAFGPGGWQGSSLARVLPVSLDGERRRDSPSLALALVIDRSGSMAGEKMELAKEAARATAEVLSPDDALEVIGFDTVAERIVPLQSAANRVAIQRDIGRLAPRGGTAIFPALDAAYQDLAASRAATRHVILLTDGQTNEPGVVELVHAMRGDRITVTSVGVGSDVNRTLLSEIADVGGGRAYFTADPSSIPRIFLREASTVGQSGVVESLVRIEVASRAHALRGLDLARAPLLRGYVVTQARGAPSELLLRSELGDPLLARRPLDEGSVVAWTSDVAGRWSADLLRWPASPRFFSQLLRDPLRPSEGAALPLEARVEDDELVLSADAFDERDEFRSNETVRARVEGPLDRRADERVSVEVELAPIAPGRLEARLPLDRYGAYSVEAIHREDGVVLGTSHASPVFPYPAEYARLEPDPALLRTLAERTGGEVLVDHPERLFEHTREERLEADTERTPLVLLAALALLVLDVLARRTLRAS